MPGETLTRAREHVVGPLAQIPRGEGRNFEVDGTMIAVFRGHQDQVYACQAACPHLGGPLADGMMGGSTIMCPLHDRSYDLLTGKVLAGECDIAVYPARTTPDGTVMVRLE